MTIFPELVECLSCGNHFNNKRSFTAHFLRTSCKKVGSESAEKPTPINQFKSNPANPTVPEEITENCPNCEHCGTKFVKQIAYDYHKTVCTNNPERGQSENRVRNAFAALSQVDLLTDVNLKISESAIIEEDEYVGYSHGTEDVEEGNPEVQEILEDMELPNEVVYEDINTEVINPIVSEKLRPSEFFFRKRLLGR